MAAMRHAFARACLEGDAARTQALLDEAPDPDHLFLGRFNSGLMHVAARRGHVSVLEVLLAARPHLAFHDVDYGFDTQSDPDPEFHPDAEPEVGSDGESDSEPPSLLSESDSGTEPEQPWRPLERAPGALPDFDSDLVAETLGPTDASTPDVQRSAAFEHALGDSEPTALAATAVNLAIAAHAAAAGAQRTAPPPHNGASSATGDSVPSLVSVEGDTVVGADDEDDQEDSDYDEESSDYNEDDDDGFDDEFDDEDDVDADEFWYPGMDGHEDDDEYWGYDWGFEHGYEDEANEDDDEDSEGSGSDYDLAAALATKARGDLPLHRAAAYGEAEACRVLLAGMRASDASCSRPGLRLWDAGAALSTAISLAARGGHLGAVLVLVEAAESEPVAFHAIGELIRTHSSGKHRATSEILRELLRLYEYAPAPSVPPSPQLLSRVASALYRAVYGVSLDTLGVLLHAPFDLSARCPVGDVFTVILDDALCMEGFPMVAFLLDKARELPRDAAADRQRAMKQACRVGNVETFIAVLRLHMAATGVAETFEGSILREALQLFTQTRGEWVRRLLAGAPGLYPAFECATQHAWEQLDEALHQAVSTAAHTGVREASSACVEALLEAVPASQQTPRPGFGGRALCAAAESGNVQATRVLVRHDAVDVLSRTEYGRTALDDAVAECPLEDVCEMLRALLESPQVASAAARRTLIDRVNVHDAPGQEVIPALCVAASQGRPDVVRQLLEAGADCTVQDHERGTALRYAAGCWAGVVSAKLVAACDGREVLLGAPSPRSEVLLAANLLFLDNEGGYAQVVRDLTHAEALARGDHGRAEAEISTSDLVREAIELTGVRLPMKVTWDEIAALDTSPFEDPCEVNSIALMWDLVHKPRPPRLRDPLNAAELMRVIAQAVRGCNGEIVHLVLARYPGDAWVSSQCLQALSDSVTADVYMLRMLLRGALACKERDAREISAALASALRGACKRKEPAAVRELLAAQWPDGALAAELAGCTRTDESEDLIGFAMSGLPFAENCCAAEVVGALLDAGARPFTEPDDGESGCTQHIHSAVHPGVADVLRVLLRCPGQLELRDIEGQTPLHLAASSNDVDAVRLLLAAHAAEGVSIDLLNEGSVTPLYNALRKHSLEAVRLLLEAGADASFVHPQMGHTVLHATVQFRFGEGPVPADRGRQAWALVPLLLSADRPPDVHARAWFGDTAAELAAQAGDDRFLRALHDADPSLLIQARSDASWPSLLWIACRHGSCSVVRFLLSLSLPADASILCIEPLPHYPSANKNDKAYAARAASTAVTPLMAAAAHGESLSVVRVLLDDAQHGCLNAVCSLHKRSALHYAARYGHAQVVRALVKAHKAADAAFRVDVLDAFGATPLQYAFQYARYPVAKYLLSQGAQLGHTASHGRSMLQIVLADEVDTCEAVWLSMKLLEQDYRDGTFNVYRELLLDSPTAGEGLVTPGR